MLGDEIVLKPDPSDEEIIAEFYSRDLASQEADSAFEILVKRHGPRLLRAAWFALRAEGPAAECVQDTWLHVFRTHPQCRTQLKPFTDRGPGSFRKWLNTVLSNQIRDTLRARRRATMQPEVGEGLGVPLDALLGAVARWLEGDTAQPSADARGAGGGRRAASPVTPESIVASKERLAAALTLTAEAIARLDPEQLALVIDIAYRVEHGESLGGPADPRRVVVRRIERFVERALRWARERPPGELRSPLDDDCLRWFDEALEGTDRRICFLSGLERIAHVDSLLRVGFELLPSEFDRAANGASLESVLAFRGDEKYRLVERVLLGNPRLAVEDIQRWFEAFFASLGVDASIYVV